MISGVMPGIFTTRADLLLAKSPIRAGREEFGSPFCRAAAVILLGKSFEILEWNIAPSKALSQLDCPLTNALVRVLTHRLGRTLSHQAT